MSPCGIIRDGVLDCDHLAANAVHLPLNAVLVSLVFATLLFLINNGSTVARNATLALDCASLLSSYMISIGCLVLKRLRGEALPPRRWSWGRLGLAINVAALCWLLPIFVFVLFSGTLPVAANTVNYGSLLFGSMVIFSTLYYIMQGRRVYTSPMERLQRDLQNGDI